MLPGRSYLSRRAGPQHFVGVGQVDEIDVAVEVRVLVPELHHYALQLQVLRLCFTSQEPNWAECLLFSLSGGRRFVKRWMAKQFDSVFGSAGHVPYRPFLIHSRQALKLSFTCQMLRRR